MPRTVSGLRKQRLYSSSACLAEEREALIGLGELLLDEEVRVGAHQPLRHRRLLDHEEPVIRAGRPRLRDVVEQMMLRDDVLDRGAQHFLGMIEAHAVHDARAAVVAGGKEAVEAERRHHLDIVLRHRAERIVRVIRLARRLLAVAIAAQVGRHHGEFLRKARRELVPGEMRERIAVQQQQRRPAAAMHGHDARAGGLDFGAGEAVHLHGAADQGLTAPRAEQEAVRYLARRLG